MLSLSEEEIDSYKNKTFFHICKKNFCNANDSNDGSSDGRDNDEYDVRIFHGDVLRLDMMIDD